MRDGGFHGWRWYYAGGHEGPRKKGARPDLKGKLTQPDVFLQARSAPMQIAFYQGGNFPAAYQGSAFVTMHGSWNRQPRTGYKVVRLLFDGAGQADRRVRGLHDGLRDRRQEGVGPPGRLTVAQDGSLFVTEDGAGTIWRVTPTLTAAR